MSNLIVFRPFKVSDKYFNGRIDIKSRLFGTDVSNTPTVYFFRIERKVRVWVYVITSNN
ncbi:hypothetical protein ABIB40_003127 [Pedobacter sp. UYP30]